MCVELSVTSAVLTYYITFFFICVLFYRVPGQTDAPDKGGGTCDHSVDLMSIYPTLIELAGLPPSPEVEGYSVTKLVKNPQAKWGKAAITSHGNGHHAVKKHNYRYILYNDGSEELYNHKNDPQEWDNLAGKSPKVRAKRKAKLRQQLPDYLAPPRPKDK